MTQPSFLDRLTRWLWILVVLFIPVTSFRYFPFLGRETQVRPLSLYPLAGLLVLLVIRQWKRREVGLRSPALTALVAFVLVALAATTFGALYAPLDLLNQSYTGRALRAWVTLLIGLAFFLASIWMNESEDDLKTTLKWLYAGLFLHIAWGGVQAIGIFTNILPKGTVDAWQELFSIRGLVNSRRVSGLAFEPSWLAGQLVTLYLPWLYASLARGYRLFRWRWVEPLLVAGSMGIMLLTYSRSGVLLIVVVAGLTFLLADWGRVKQAWDWFAAPFSGSKPQARRAEPSRSIPAPGHWLSVGVRIAAVLVVFAGAVGAFKILSEREYFARLWRADKSNLVEYMVDIYAGPRLAYATAAWDIFDTHPLTGVGIGASGLYMHAAMPDWARTTIPEIAKLFSPDNRIYPNPKNMYLRLLAETGLVGFWLFVLFNLAALAQVIKWMRSPGRLAALVGVAGLFTWLALVTYHFTQDSFAMPNLWVGLGMVLGLTLNTHEDA
jgi:O-antigen ligase